MGSLSFLFLLLFLFIPSLSLFIPYLFPRLFLYFLHVFGQRILYAGCQFVEQGVADEVLGGGKDDVTCGHWMGKRTHQRMLLRGQLGYSKLWNERHTLAMFNDTHKCFDASKVITSLAAGSRFKLTKLH